MAAPTVKDVRERIQDILTTHLSAVVKTVQDGAECALMEDQLPAAIVMTRAATRTSTNANRHLTTRTYEVILLVTRVCKEGAEEQRRVFDATEVLADVLPDYFTAKAHRLELNNAALTGVFEVGDVTDDGPEFDLWGGETYGAIRCRIPVTTYR